MKILAIETSCDETGIALLDCSGGLSAPEIKILRNLVSSQVKIHAPFGGVVPNLAKREHLKNLPLLYKRISSRVSRGEPDLIAVTVGPGLEPALWTGITFAQRLSKEINVRPAGANHLEGHLYSFLLSQKTVNTKSKITNYKEIFPAICLIVSGGHTILLKMDSLSKWKTLGETRDDAAGEAFDKVSRMLDLPYPGGPEIEKLARFGNPDAIQFPRPMIHDKNYDFSFSGLKTSVLYYLRNVSDPNATNSHPNPPKISDSDHSDKLAVSDRIKAEIAASFQKAAVDVLATKTMRAARKFGAKSVMLSGGVAANKMLRKTLKSESRKIGAQFFVPPIKFNTDNAAMIGVAGYMTYLRKKKYSLEAAGDLDLG